MQILLTTHSVTLASSIKLNNLIIFTEGKAFSLADGNTQLHAGDYKFLERFLDSTKANLFFAKGIVIVEGDAENIFLPTFAQKLGKSFAKNGVSVVNVGSTALLRYSSIFLRTQAPLMSVPVAIITDCDEAVSKIVDDSIEMITDRNSHTQRSDKVSKYSQDNVKAFVSSEWTLEFDIACSVLKTELCAAILMARAYINEDKALSEQRNHRGIKKISEYLKGATENINKWTLIDKNPLYVASEIVRNLVLQKNISKTVVAQCFSEILKERTFLEEEVKAIREDKYLKYLVNAIDYVTGVAIDE